MKSNIFILIDLARRGRKIFAIIGIIYHFLSIPHDFLLLFKYCFVAIKHKSSWEKNLMKKNLKKLYSSETSKNSIFGRFFFSGYPPPPGGGGVPGQITGIKLPSQGFYWN